MSWLKIDDRLWSHRKAVEVGDAALGLWLRLACWSAQHEEDGHVPGAVVRMLAAGEDRGDHVAALLAAGLLDEAPDGFMVHDFLQYNPSRATLQARRDADRARKHGLATVPADSDRIPNGIRSDSKRRPSVTVARNPGRDGRDRNGSICSGSDVLKAHHLAAFEAFAGAYPPGRCLRAPAATEWARLDPDDETVAAILAAVRAWATSDEWTAEGGRFVPRADRWLRDEGWTAPPPAKRPTRAAARQADHLAGIADWLDGDEEDVGT